MSDMQVFIEDAQPITVAVSDAQPINVSLGEAVNVYLGGSGGNEASQSAGVNSHAQIDIAITESKAHIDDTNNPHSVTKSQVGLSNVPNTDFTAAVAANTAKRTYPSADQAKLASIEEGAEVNEVSASDLALKTNITDIVDNLTSISATVPLSANQGRVLNGLIDTINTAINSDDTTLDELQEIVDFIKLNREDLDSLTITSIAGLQVALDGKQAVGDYATNTFLTNGLATKAATSHSHPQSDITNLSTDLAAKVAATTLAASGKGYVNHGSTAGTARPSGYASIEWEGSVAPTNATSADTWIDTA